MEFDFSQLPAAHRYKLLVGLVVPRPIALVTTVGRGGVVNAAPFSFFNVLGDDPPILVVSIENKADGSLKDTARNIHDSREFVVNLVDEAIANRMHECSRDFPSDVSEPTQVGLSTAASRSVSPPRIAEAPASLECRLYHYVPIGERRHLMIGEVSWLHCREGLVDPVSLRIAMDHYFPVGRLFADRYARVRDQFTVDSSPEYLASIRSLGRL